LCAFRVQDTSAKADALVAQLRGDPFYISDAVETEFRASLEFQVFLYDESLRLKLPATKGFCAREALNALATFNTGVVANKIRIAKGDWRKIFHRTNNIAAQYARAKGAKTLDILHVATAIQLKFKHFASFDGCQIDLAKCCGLEVVPST
jgi:predicted nucleic acid-binding protein